MRHYYPAFMEPSPCEYDLCEWVRTIRTGTLSILHLGCGGHHLVGRELAPLSHFVLGITMSGKEHAEYYLLTETNPKVHSNYRVMFADMYTLRTGHLPKFDIVTLFHLCEYTPDGSEKYSTITDSELLYEMVRVLNPSGQVVLFNGSRTYGPAKTLVDSHPDLVRISSFKSIELYGKHQ